MISKKLNIILVSAGLMLIQVVAEPVVSLHSTIDLTSLPGWPESVQPGTFPQLDSDVMLPRGHFTVSLETWGENGGSWAYLLSPEGQVVYSTASGRFDGYPLSNDAIILRKSASGENDEVSFSLLLYKGGDVGFSKEVSALDELTLSTSYTQDLALQPRLNANFFVVIDPNSLIAHVFKIDNNGDVQFQIGVVQNEITLKWNASLNRTYAIETTESLEKPWVQFDTKIIGNDNEIELSIPFASSPKFLRLVEQ